MGVAADWGTNACDITFAIYGCPDSAFIIASYYTCICLGVISALSILFLWRRYPDFVRGPARIYFQWRFAVMLYQISRCIFTLAANPFGIANHVLAFYVFWGFNACVTLMINESGCAATRVLPLALLDDVNPRWRVFVRFAHSKAKTRLMSALLLISTAVLAGFLAADADDWEMSIKWIAAIEAVQVVTYAAIAICFVHSYWTMKEILAAYLNPTTLSQTMPIGISTRMDGSSPNLAPPKEKGSPLPRLGLSTHTGSPMSADDDMLPPVTSGTRSIGRLSECPTSPYPTSSRRQRSATASKELLQIRLTFAFEQMRNNLTIAGMGCIVNIFYVVCRRQVETDARYRIILIIFYNILLNLSPIIQVARVHKAIKKYGRSAIFEEELDVPMVPNENSPHAAGISKVDKDFGTFGRSPRVIKTVSTTSAGAGVSQRARQSASLPQEEMDPIALPDAMVPLSETEEPIHPPITHV